MAPSKAPTSWEEEESDSSSGTSAPVIARRSKFEDEEDDGDVLDSWDAAEDSEVEREKEKKAAEAKAKAEAEAKANKKSKSQRVEELREANRRKKMEEDMEAEESDEDEATKRARIREEEKQADLANAEDLFGGGGSGPAKRTSNKAVTVQEGDDPTSTIDLSSLKLFQPQTAGQFTKLKETLAPLLTSNAKKPQYAIMMQDFTKQLVKDLNSEQIKKIASGLSTMSNEKMREEKAAEKGGKKTKAAKTKATLSASRDESNKADTTAYDDNLDEDDFM